MKLVISSLAVIIILSGCSKRDEPYKPTAQEMKDRNDTSYYKRPDSRSVGDF